MKQNDVVTYTAQAYSDGETVGSVGEYTLFVPFMAQGETAEVKVNYVKGSVAYADVVRITRPSPHRVTPPCPLFGRCGGCALMHLQYAEQLRFKTLKVQNALRKIGGITAEVSPCVPSPLTVRYRNKLSLPVRGKRGNVKIGMYRRGSHTVVDSDDCLLGNAVFADVVNIFRSYLNDCGAQPYDEKTFGGEVRHLVARYVDGQLLLTVVSNGKWRHDLSPLYERLKKKFPQTGIFINENNLRNNVIMDKKTLHVCGIEYIKGVHAGVPFRLGADSFFQVNDGVKDILYQKVKQSLRVAGTQVLIDCFSGIGVLTNALADQNYLTYGVEIVPQAVQDANAMSKLANGKVINVCGDANEVLPRLAKEHEGKKMCLVVDPPRKGLGEKVCETVTKTPFSDVVYVSCNPATLARDLKTLSQIYDVTAIQPYDMFPHTDQVESVVCLKRQSDVI